MGTTKKRHLLVCNTESSDHMRHAGRDLTFLYQYRICAEK